MSSGAFGPFRPAVLKALRHLVALFPTASPYLFVLQLGATCYIVLIMTARLEAARLGQTKYLGTACKHGHDGWRYTTSGGCIQCVIASNKAHRDNFVNLIKEAKK